MDQIKTSKNHTKFAILSIVSLVVAASLLVLVLEKTRITNLIINPFAKTSTPKEDPIDTLNKADSTTGNKANIPVDPNIDNSKNTATIPTNDGAKLTFQTLAQADNEVTISTVASTSLPSNGTCTIIFEKDGARPITRSTTATNHICGPISIPEFEFTTIGEWKITARYFTNNSQVIATDRIEIK